MLLFDFFFEVEGKKANLKEVLSPYTLHTHTKKNVVVASGGKHECGRV